METKIVVPTLGESIVEATVARWLKNESDTVEAGETLVELETDKVNLEVGAERAGKLSKILRQNGEDVKIGDVLGILEDAPAQPAVEKATPSPEKENEKERVKATPSARRLAQEHGVDLNEISGTGSGNQVTRQDIETYLTKDKKPEQAAPPSSDREQSRPEVEEEQPAPVLLAPVSARREERVRMSRRRQTIARRLVEAQRTAAMLTTYNELDMSKIQELRVRHKEAFKQRKGIGLGILSFFVKAATAALKEFPALNAEIQENEILFKHYYDIGVAIGAAEGLVVPVLRDADRMSFADIEKGIKDFAARAEAGTLTLEDLRGGTFTITNGGVFGSLLSTPILNPPQVGILGLHKIEERPLALNGQVVIRPMMYVALSYDHRIVDGRESVQFLARIKSFIEDPASLLF